MADFWADGFWADGFWAAGFWAEEAEPGVLTITTASFPNGYDGVPYSTRMYVTGGTLPYEAPTVTSGALPNGLSFGAFVPAAGEVDGYFPLTGTPTVQATFTPTVKVVDAMAEEDSQGFSILIDEAPTELGPGDRTTLFTKFMDANNGHGNDRLRTAIASTGDLTTDLARFLNQ